MSEISSPSDTARIVSTATSEAKELLDESFARLKEVASTKGARGPGPNDKFFPHGVELIYIKVEAGLTEKTKISVEIKIAGEKGIKGAITAIREDGSTS